MQTMNNIYSNVFLGSFDPIHISHLSTRAQSEKELGETQIIVCNNGLKDDWRLSLEQRRKDIIYSLLLCDDFDERKRDPEKIVSIAETKSDIFEIINKSDKVVRGIRSSEDINYIKKLLEYYQIKNAKEKWFFVHVPESLKDISSTKNKIILQEFIKEFDYIPKIYRESFWKSAYNKLKNTAFTDQITDIEESTRTKIIKNISTYFSKLETFS